MLRNPGEHPDEAFRQSMQWRWWLLGVVVALAGAGWAARGALVLKGEYDQDKGKADAVHLTMAAEDKKQEEKISDIRVINARIEVQNDMLSNQLDRINAQQDVRSARRPAERRAAEAKVKELGRKVAVRKKAISASRREDSDDPLAGLEDL